MFTTKKTLGAILAISAFSLSVPVAFAGDFDVIDADISGGLSLAEVQAVAPDVTEDEFVSFDIDGSGELSPTEFDAWKASKVTDDTQEEEPQGDDSQSDGLDEEGIIDELEEASEGGDGAPEDDA